MVHTKKNIGLVETQDMNQKKTQLPLIHLCEVDIKAIITWMDQRDKKSIAVNYEAWTTGNHTHVAACMLIETELERNKKRKSQINSEI